MVIEITMMRYRRTQWC